jgi:cystathionine beta-lyase/cystathionine gamma-synthase
MTLPLRHLDSLAIHGGTAERPRTPGDPVVPPLVRAATFHGGGPDDPEEVWYQRYGNSLNQIEVGRKLARLEGGEAGIGVASGMAAISLSLLSLTRAGDHLISSSELYGATRVFMEVELARRGVEVTFLDPSDPDGWKRALRPSTRAFYLESPTNPNLRVRDPRPLGALARASGIPLIVDATFATPILFRPLQWGADLVLHSATKYLGGHSDISAGVVCGTSERLREIEKLVHLYGPSLAPDAAWLLDRGLRTLGVRMAGHSANASVLARWFRDQPGVGRVVHLSLEDHPDRALYETLMTGPGGMLGVILEGGASASDAFCRALRIAAVAPSLGGVETLVSLPRLTSHRTVSAEVRARMGIPDGFVRISVGLEGVEDLKEDFGRAIEAAASAR